MVFTVFSTVLAKILFLPWQKPILVFDKVATAPIRLVEATRLEHRGLLISLSVAVSP